MSRKKTKKEKLKSVARKKLQPQFDSQKMVYTFTETESEQLDSIPSNTKQTTPQINLEKILGYNPEFLIKDLKKTMFLSGLIFAIEISLYLGFRSGLFS